MFMAHFLSDKKWKEWIECVYHTSLKDDEMNKKSFKMAQKYFERVEKEPTLRELLESEFFHTHAPQLATRAPDFLSYPPRTSVSFPLRS